MKIINHTWLVLTAFLCLFNNNANAQITEECTTCPMVFFDNVVNGLIVNEIQVSGHPVDDLGATPLTSVCLEIDHTWLGDIYIVLESPAGKTYFLMGDDNNNSGGCGDAVSNVNACFIPGTSNPMTNGTGYMASCVPGDVCISGDWNVGCGSAMVSDLLPTASAAPNCDLSDFNASGDPVNGTWRAIIGCVCGMGEGGVLLNWSLEFQEPSSLECTGPETTIAGLIQQPCENDDLMLEAGAGIAYEWSGPNGFQSDQSSIVLTDFSDQIAGLYSCKIETEEECYDLHEFKIDNICQKENISFEEGKNHEICVSNLISIGFCNELSSDVLDIQVTNDNCLQITGLSTGVDSVYIWESHNGMEVYYRYTVEVMEAQPVSVNEGLPEGWLLSPNPSSGNAVLRTPGVLPTAISVIDLQGKVLQKLTATSERTEMNLENLTNGFYIVSIETETGIYYERIAIAK